MPHLPDAGGAVRGDHRLVVLHRLRGSFELDGPHPAVGVDDAEVGRVDARPAWNGRGPRLPGMSEPQDETAQDAEDVAFVAAWRATDDGRRLSVDDVRAQVGLDCTEPRDGEARAR